MRRARKSSERVTCPICRGEGSLPDPRKKFETKAAEKAAMARTLREAGYSLRQIQEFIGWKSVRSAANACETAEERSLRMGRDLANHNI
jgi:DNA-binding transcriptional MerR regulator